MAGIRAFAKTAELSLSPAVTKTLLQILAPGNQRILIKRWGIYFDGIEPLNEPVEVWLRKQTTGGTMASNTPVKITPGNEALQVTATDNATAEPTNSDILDLAEVHPQSGYEVLLPLGEEIVVAGGERVAILARAAQTVKCRSKIYWEE